MAIPINKINAARSRFFTPFSLKKYRPINEAKIILLSLTDAT
jgi:hypothetical protein